MEAESHEQQPRPAEDRRAVYRDLRRRNERRLEAAQVLEDRRRRQIERTIQMVRESRPRGPRG
jgi:hypothetical protein